MGSIDSIDNSGPLRSRLSAAILFGTKSGILVNSSRRLFARTARVITKSQSWFPNEALSFAELTFSDLRATIPTDPYHIFPFSYLRYSGSRSDDPCVGGFALCLEVFAGGIHAYGGYTSLAEDRSLAGAGGRRGVSYAELAFEGHGISGYGQGVS